MPFAAMSIFIDESSQTDNRYLVLGAVIVPDDQISEIENALAAVRLPELPHGELKWAKVSKSKIEAYQRYVEAFFRFRDAHFHSIVVDTTQIKHQVFNAGDRDTGFNKEIYQLVMKCGRLYREPIFHVYPDRRSTPHSTTELRSIINHGMHKKLGRSREWPVRKLHFRDSKSTPCLHLADIFAGAIAYQHNGHGNKPGASPARKQLAARIFELAHVRNPTLDTNIGGKFTIWHRVLRSGVPQP